MRFHFAVMAPKDGAVSATAAEMEAIDAFNDKIEFAGQRVFAAGIAGPDSATVFDNRSSVGHISSGPLNDVDQFMAGFWIIDVDSVDMAHQLAAEASLACNRVIEVRPLLG